MQILSARFAIVGVFYFNCEEICEKIYRNTSGIETPKV